MTATRTAREAIASWQYCQLAVAAQHWLSWRRFVPLPAPSPRCVHNSQSKANDTLNMMAAKILMLLPMITMVCATDCNQLGKRTCQKRKKCNWASDKFQIYQANADSDTPWVYGACFGPTDCARSVCEWKIAN